MTGERLSVCIATFNGARFVREQLRSILVQLSADDEVVIVDDASVDETVDLVQSLGDPRVRLLRSARNSGHVAAFESALRHSTGSVVMLSDQDDLWPEGRVRLMLAALERSHFVVGNQQEFPEPRAVRSAFLNPAMSRTPARNVTRLVLGRQPYFGCAMAFRRELVELALPFPSHVEAHDHWLAMIANAVGPFPHLGEVVVLRRVHRNNQTPHKRRPLPAVLRSRWWLGINLVRAVWRRRHWAETRLPDQAG